jgi:hypothetical protein
MGGRARVSKKIDCANCVAGNMFCWFGKPRNQLELGSLAAHH